MLGDAIASKNTCTCCIWHQSMLLSNDFPSGSCQAVYFCSRGAGSGDRWVIVRVASRVAGYQVSQYHAAVSGVSPAPLTCYQPICGTIADCGVIGPLLLLALSRTLGVLT